MNDEYFDPTVRIGLRSASFIIHHSSLIIHRSSFIIFKQLCPHNNHRTMNEPVTNVQIEDSWKQALADEFQQPYFAAIKTFLVQEKQAGKVIYPPGPLIFNAFNHTPF